MTGERLPRARSQNVGARPDGDGAQPPAPGAPAPADALPAGADPTDHLVVDDTRYETQLTRKFRERAPWRPRDPRLVTAQIPGLIQEVLVTPGQRVDRDQGVVVLEAMKMRNEVLATAAGVVTAVHVEPGQTVPRGAVLVELDQVDD